MPNIIPNRLSGCLVTVLFVSGCSSVSPASSQHSQQEEQQEVQKPRNFTLSENQSYLGVLPCASCPGIETHLDLLVNGRYILTENYQDRPDGRSSRMGLWEIEHDRLVLHHGKDEHLVYFANESGGLLQGDTLGRPIISEMNYTLEPIGWQPAQVHKQMDGMLTYMADAPSMVECNTGLRFPIVMTPEWIEVERAYSGASSIRGGYLHTRANVSLTWETPEEGPTRHHLRFKDLQQVLPATTCGSPIVSLENHEWDLKELDGFIPAEIDRMQNRPNIRFSGQQLSGHSGCNIMAGAIHIEGDHLEIGPVASTRMFCQDAAEVESRFLQVTEEATYSSLEGQQWSWYDEDMKRLASFERKPTEQ